MAVQTQQAFRFLDLPKELRLMVYERVPITTPTHVLEDPVQRKIQRQNGGVRSETMLHPSVTHVTKSVNVGLLRTCRLIYAEAKLAIASRLQHEPTRYLFRIYSLHGNLSCQFHDILHWMQSCEMSYRQNDPIPSITDVAKEGGSHGQQVFKRFATRDTIDPGDAEYEPTRRFLHKCARKNVIIHTHQPEPRCSYWCIGIQLPSPANAERLRTLITSTQDTLSWWYTISENQDTTALCLVVQRRTGKDRQASEELHEMLQYEAEEWMRMWRPSEPSFRLEQPSCEEWKRDWEDGDKF
ncbi:hypothetical protein FB567DRAFT_344975 [Paraphoma chrysanthemicola]|uniref:Uncharacterized protein n=1 Tax=Paraphoma chrysanthemicola TaxID=798071 RepID=A0A8K0VYY7_9PLEO|nr:hypothetical protein FB567DRAFT_344975 [Paraphoma chrysanthemicola]